MAHIHDLIDFTVGAYIVHENKVLLVDHIKLKTWMPIGGHIELDEDPEQAIVREIKEESGLEVEIIGALKPDILAPGVKPLLAPVYMDIHDINESHKHIGLVYFSKSNTSKVTLAEEEHHDIKWFTKEELSNPKFAVRPYIKFYAEQALEKLSKD